MTLHSAAVLRLADAHTWRIVAADQRASLVVQRFRESMTLSLVGTSDCELLVVADERDVSTRRKAGTAAQGIAKMPVRYLGGLEASRLPLSIWLSGQGELIRLHAQGAPLLRRIHLSIIAQSIVRQVQARDGLLLHGALAELNGAGVVLAGPSGVGKTTASSRLSDPWHSRSDDAALIVKAADGRYWAHPWPTWSRVGISGGLDPSWDVQRAVPLAALCFLSQSAADAITPMGAGRAAGLLAQSAEQAAALMPYTSVADRRAKRLQRLDNACALSRSVPSYQLELSLTGAFWHLLDDVVSARAPGLSPARADRPAAAGI